MLVFNSDQQKQRQWWNNDDIWFRMIDDFMYRKLLISHQSWIRSDWGGGGSWSVLTYIWKMNRNEEILFKKRISGMHYQDRLCTLLIMFQLHSVTKIRMSNRNKPSHCLSPRICVLVRSVWEGHTRMQNLERQDFLEVSKTVKRTVLLTCKSTHLL